MEIAMDTHFYCTKERNFDYLTYENEIKKIGKRKYIEKIFQEAEFDYDLFLAKITSLGVEIDEITIKNEENPYQKYYTEILNNEMSIKDKNKIKSHLKQVEALNGFFAESNSKSDKELKKNSKQKKYMLVKFIIFLELQLSILEEIKEGKIIDESISPEKAKHTFDSYIFSSGNILKYLMYFVQLDEQYGCNRIFSEKDVSEIANFFIGYRERDNLMDVFEYWKYSKIEINSESNKNTINFLDEAFNRAVLVGNYRYKNFMWDIEKDITSKVAQKMKSEKSVVTQESVDNSISRELCLRHFGRENMTEKFLDVELTKWIDAIEFLKGESFNYSIKRKDVLSVNNLCIVKKEFEWKKKLMEFSHAISDNEAEVIINKLTFDKKSKDLVDAPLIKIKDKLILLPILTKQMRPLSAILSMFSRYEKDTKNNWGFKEYVLEARIKKLLDKSGNIHAVRLHKYITDQTRNEKETDLAFVLEDDLFIIECKNFNQPYTVREHAKTNGKIREAITQLNKSANFFEEHLDVVKEQLSINKDKSIKATHRILLTAAILGVAGKQENVWVVDEASFMKFLSKKRNLSEIPVEKILNFLESQVSIKNMQKKITRVWDEQGDIKYHCVEKIIEDI
ncbi:hypothetical protein GBO84_03130 [Pediococcus pentosaceus]|nr:hypothetical protein GBO84_03130 [Pediococcus pentosaceus]